MKGVLNLFQSTMLRWRDLHPYNAVHAVALPAGTPPGALATAIACELEHCGLTGLTLDRRRGRYEYRGGSSKDDLAVVAAEKMLPALESAIERHLNTPFAEDGPIEPFRFFRIDAADGCMLGLAYDHFVAAGDCIMELLHAIVDRAGGVPPQAGRPLLYPPREMRLFLRNAPRLAAGLARLPALVRSARTTARPRYRDVMDGHTGYALLALCSERCLRLRRVARTWGLTLNDMLLALLLHALDPMVPQRRQARRRRCLAVASIMNLRNEYGEAGRTAFGQFLGSLRVSHPVPPGLPLEALAREVHAQTTQVKREKLYLQTLLAMRYVSAVWPLLAPAQRAGFYAKTYPIWAGLSMLNVNALWRRADKNQPVPIYIRGVPTGPLAPIVLAVTTVGDALYAGISYRTTAFGRADIDNLWSGIEARIDDLP